MGFTVVSYICDGASEHAKLFEGILKDTASTDPSLRISRDGSFAISDPPHLIKKFRNNFISSGQHEFHTKNLRTPDGHHIHWSVIDAVYDMVTKNDSGQNRFLTLIRKLTVDVVRPTSIQKLRVSLAAIVFSKDVRDFVRRHVDQIATKSGLRPCDVRATLEFMNNVDELFQIMNSREPVTWTDELDDSGIPIGLRDKVNTDGKWCLNKYADVYGVRVETLIEASGLQNPQDVPPKGDQGS